MQGEPQFGEKGISLFDGLPGGHDRLDIHLDGDEYKNFKPNEGASMLGYFTQTLQDAGFPWKVHAATEKSDGTFKRGSEMSEMDAIKNLKAGKPVMLQPMRNLQLDLSSGSIGALAAAGSISGGEMASVNKVAAFSKDAKVSGGNQGLELRFGEPVVISSMGELKLLFQMYNPNEKIKGKSDTAEAAHHLSYFTAKTAGSAYPWRFFVKDEGSPVGRVAKALVKQTATGALVGGAAGALLGAPIGIFARDWKFVAGVATVVAGIGGLRGAFDAVRTASKGKPINAVDALQRVLNNQDVVFQETHARSIGVPILGSVSWFSDHGKGSTISSPEELETYFYMQSQTELPKPEKKEEKKEEKPEPARTIVIDNSVHYHVGGEHLHVGPERHQHDHHTHQTHVHPERHYILR